ncbi:MAG TPA: hypothetical protein DCL54_11935 [Alphaproteobacteria bacterium]|nr:hypothetical protein [Alphaproteobacteria bacterium]HAJ47277.1 hypothetical protein [Alphaproteobacteria bacterium]
MIRLGIVCLAMSIGLQACNAPPKAGCGAEEAAQAVEDFAKALKQAHQSGALTPAQMRSASSQMSEAGAFYSKTNDANKYCADIAQIRQSLGLSVQ